MDSSGVVDAGALHTLIKNLHSLGNEVRLRFIDALRTLHDDSLCFELGYTSYHQYCERELGLARSTAFEYLRTATALESLPRLRSLFGQGELSWHQVREICRVAIADTEVAWIELALDSPINELLAEVKEALRTGRTAPREKRLGLPNLLVKVTVVMTLEDKERVRTAFALMGDALGSSAPDDGHEVKPVLVRWADGVLSGAIPRTPSRRRPVGGAQAADADGEVPPGSKRHAAGAKDRPTPAQTIVYHTCRECRATTVGTADGLVEVPPERIQVIAGQSTTVRIDPDEELEVEVRPVGRLDNPNSPRLSRQVLARDGLTCSNPGCGRRRNLQAHHIIFRSNGGSTSLPNEVAVCDTCHSMLHKGLLEVRGSPYTGLEWVPRPSAPGAKVRDSLELRALLDRMLNGATSVTWSLSDAVTITRPDTILAREPAIASPSALVGWPRGADSQVPDPGQPRTGDLDVLLVESTVVDSPSAAIGESAVVDSPPNSHASIAPAPARGAVPRVRPQIAAEPDLELRLRLLEEGLVSLSFTPDEAAERIRQAYMALVTSARSAAEATDSPAMQPTDDGIITLAIYGEAKAAAVWEFHAKRGRGISAP